MLAQTGFDPGVSRTQTEYANHRATNKTGIIDSIAIKLVRFNNYWCNDVTGAMIVYMYKTI